jgi:hypothetical protein
MTDEQIDTIRRAKHDADVAAECLADYMAEREYDTLTALLSAYLDSARRELAELLPPTEPAR